MPYITRDSDGQIKELHDEPPQTLSERVDFTDPEVIQFLNQINITEEARDLLYSTDHELVRVIEDLVDLLIEKRIFVYTELPDAVQNKIKVRKQLRNDLNTLGNLIDEDNNLF